MLPERLQCVDVILIYEGYDPTSILVYTVIEVNYWIYLLFG